MLDTLVRILVWPAYLLLRFKIFYAAAMVLNAILGPNLTACLLVFGPAALVLLAGWWLC